VLVEVEAVNVAVIIVTSNAVDPGRNTYVQQVTRVYGICIRIITKCPRLIGSFPLPEFLRNTTVDEDVAAVFTLYLQERGFVV
jgi:hypothetical protein